MRWWAPVLPQVLREDGDCMYLYDQSGVMVSAFAKTDDGAFKEYGTLDEMREVGPPVPQIAPVALVVVRPWQEVRHQAHRHHHRPFQAAVTLVSQYMR